MPKTLPEPGFYRSGDKDVIVLDTRTLGDTPEEDGAALLTKDGDDARWSPAVAFRLAFRPSPLYVLSASVFDHRFKPTTQEEALKRVQDEERAASQEAGDKVRAEEAGSQDANATAEGADSSSSADEASETERRNVQ